MVASNDWRPVPGFEGKYEVSKALRQVRSLPREIKSGFTGVGGRRLKGGVLKPHDGKVKLALGRSCSHKTYKLDEVIALAFGGGK